MLTSRLIVYMPRWSMHEKQFSHVPSPNGTSERIMLFLFCSTTYCQYNRISINNRLKLYVLFFFLLAISSFRSYIIDLFNITPMITSSSRLCFAICRILLAQLSSRSKYCLRTISCKLRKSVASIPQICFTSFFVPCRHRLHSPYPDR